MSQENVEIARAAMFPQGNLVGLTDSGELERGIDLGIFADDVEIAFATPGGGPMNEYVGLDGFLKGWAEWMAPWARYEVDLQELRDAGERVVALVTLRGETHHDHVEIEQPGAAILTVANAKVVRVEFHLDQREALAAAGVSA
jgi:hypothetical protein